MRTLDQRAVLITGGGSGLGRAISRRLAAGGAHPVVADVDVEAAEATVRLVCDAGGSASSCRLDVTDPASVAEAIDATASRFGERFDALRSEEHTSELQSRQYP